MNNNQHGGFEV